MAFHFEPAASWQPASLTHHFGLLTKLVRFLKHPSLAAFVALSFPSATFVLTCLLHSPSMGISYSSHCPPQNGTLTTLTPSTSGTSKRPGKASDFSTDTLISHNSANGFGRHI